MAGLRWTNDDLPWDQFDPSKVDDDILSLAKSAAVVEYNSNFYADYLCDLFADDEQFHKDVRQWAREEIQHGKALGAWAEKADPTFNLEDSFKRFTDGYTPPLDASNCRRGGKSGELVARCMVETGTSSYYSAMLDATDEPVLRDISRRIAADEFRHYKLFYTYLKKYLDQEELGKVGRLKVALTRFAESEDDELAYAWHATNRPGEAYDYKSSNYEYMVRSYNIYRPQHMHRALGMIFKACGFKPQGKIFSGINSLFQWHILRKADKLAAAR